MTEATEVTEFTCCFCGNTLEDPIYLVAQWGEDGEQWQAWPVHRGCLIERMCDEAKEVGGPLFDA
jgi:hypothetical protein